MPLARLRRALTSSSTQSDNSLSSSTTTSSNTSTLDFSITTSTSPRDITTFDLPILGRSPTTRNTSPRDVFPGSPREAGFTNTTFPSPSSPSTPVSPGAQEFKRRVVEPRRSRTSTLMRMLKREKPHPAERLLKPADPNTVLVLQMWGGFEPSQESASRKRDDWEGVDPMDCL